MSRLKKNIDLKSTCTLYKTMSIKILILNLVLENDDTKDLTVVTVNLSHVGIPEPFFY